MNGDNGRGKSSFVGLSEKCYDENNLLLKLFKAIGETGGTAQSFKNQKKKTRFIQVIISII